MNNYCIQTSFSFCKSTSYNFLWSSRASRPFPSETREWGARIAQLWVHSPLTNVAWVRVAALTPYVVWIWYWISRVSSAAVRGFFYWVLQFSTLLKKQLTFSKTVQCHPLRLFGFIDVCKNATSPTGNFFYICNKYYKCLKNTLQAIDVYKICHNHQFYSNIIIVVDSTIVKALLRFSLCKVLCVGRSFLSSKLNLFCKVFFFKENTKRNTKTHRHSTKHKR